MGVEVSSSKCESVFLITQRAFLRHVGSPDSFSKDTDSASEFR